MHYRRVFLFLLFPRQQETLEHPAPVTARTGSARPETSMTPDRFCAPENKNPRHKSRSTLEKYLGKPCIRVDSGPRSAEHRVIPVRRDVVSTHFGRLLCQGFIHNKPHAHVKKSMFRAAKEKSGATTLESRFKTQRGVGQFPRELDRISKAEEARGKGAAN